MIVSGLARKILMTGLIAVAPAGSAASKSIKPADFAQVIARSCQIRTGDVSEQFFARNVNLVAENIRIRNVQKGWKGWVRVHAICRIEGGAAWGFVDINLRSGRAVCDARNWEVRVKGTRSLQ